MSFSEIIIPKISLIFTFLLPFASKIKLYLHHISRTFAAGMPNNLYDPFRRFSFTDNTCFLSGEKSTDKISVFPEWLLKRYQLEDKPIKLLDERIVTYRDITVPAAPKTIEALAALDDEISKAFSSGYKEVKQLDQLKLFQWIAGLVYGMIHYEIRLAFIQQQAAGEQVNFSQALIHKFGNLHKMLQSLIVPMEFEGISPWAILVFPVNNPPDTFSYRDEINTLTFSLRMNDFGIIACLQDNEASLNYHREVLKKIEGQPLHPIQFEELCGKFFYSAYLFNRLPEYSILATPETVYVESMNLLSLNTKPLFDEWQNKTYGQVLENFWKPWGYSLFEIIKDPEKPMSFLLDEEGYFIPADRTGLPLNGTPAE